MRMWKACMAQWKFAVTLVQSELGRSSGPYPIRRSVPLPRLAEKGSRGDRLPNDDDMQFIGT
jgi:hypothetical protein